MESIRVQIGELSFSWDEKKNRANIKNHGVAFQEAATCWLDEHAVEMFDNTHSDIEVRWLMVGRSNLGRLLTCWYSERRVGAQEVVRIIGARSSTTNEKRTYYEKK